jgi:hypothetical protein
MYIQMPDAISHLVVGAPTLCLTGRGHDSPDADGPQFVSLNGGSREANRPLIGHNRPLALLESLPEGSR